jgi:glucans biosynthesis protein C
MTSCLCEYKALVNAYKCEITEKSHFLVVNGYQNSNSRLDEFQTHLREVENMIRKIKAKLNENNDEIKRYDYLDNIKWTLTVLVIVHHSACAAGLDPIGFNLPHVIKLMQWQYHVLAMILTCNQSFFMALFFFISAYFVTPSLAKKGSGRFMTDKLKRLGIPTLMTIFIILPIVVVITSYFMSTNLVVLGMKDGSYASFLGWEGSMLKIGNIQLGVTWFCWSLIVFSALFVLGQKFFSLNKSESVGKKIPAIWKIIVFATVMIPFNYLGLYLQHLLGENFLGFHDLKYFPAYIMMFYFGIKAYKYKWLDQIIFKHAFCGILMWIFAIVLLRNLANGYGLNAEMMGRGFTAIGMSLFLIYGFKTLFNTKNKWTATLSRTAFAAYVVQQIPMAFIAGIYTPYMTQTPIINFIVIAIPSVILSFLIGFIICKLPVLNRIF